MPNARDKQLEHVQPGDAITAPAWNDLVDEVNRRSFSTLYDRREEGPRLICQNKTGSTLAAYSIVGAKRDSTVFDDTDAISFETELDEDEAIINFYVGPVAVADDGWFVPVLLTEPHKVKADSGGTYVKGSACARKNNDSILEPVDSGPYVILSGLDASNRIWAYSPAPEGTSSSGSSGNSCCCNSVTSGDLIHPDLPTDKDETTRVWTGSTCAGSVREMKIPNTAGTAVIVVPAHTPSVEYENTGDTFEEDISSSVTIEDNGGSDVTGSATNIVADWVMDWSNDPPDLILTVDCDYTP